MPILLGFCKGPGISKSTEERAHAIYTVRHSEAPPRWEFHLDGSSFRTFAREGSPAAALRGDARRVFRFRPEEPTDRGEDFVRSAAWGLRRAGEERICLARNGLPHRELLANQLHED